MPQTKILVPIAMRLAHYDAVTRHRPMSVLSVIPTDSGINYIELYNSFHLRKQARDKAVIGFGNGGATWSSAAAGIFELSEEERMVPVMSYGLWYNRQVNRWMVGWQWPRYKVDSGDYAEPMWEKVNYFSIVGDIVKLVDITQADSGTGSAQSVIARIPKYGLQLINDSWAYDWTDPEDPQPIPWAFYGISNGIKGWYLASDIEISVGHNLLSPSHTDTKPESSPKGKIIVGAGNPTKWSSLGADERKKQVLKAGANIVEWKNTPATKSVTNASDDSSLVLKGDMANVPANHFYGSRGGKVQFYKI